MRNERDSRLDGIRFEGHVRAHKHWADTPIALTDAARASDPFAGVSRAERWHDRVYESQMRAVRAADRRREERELVRKLERVSRNYIHDRNGKDSVSEENRAQFAGDDDDIGRHFGKSADSIGDSLARFAKGHDVDSPWWRMLRDLLQAHGSKTIGALDRGTRRFANYLVGKMCNA